MGLCYCPGKHVGSRQPGVVNRKKVSNETVRNGHLAFQTYSLQLPRNSVLLGLLVGPLTPPPSRLSPPRSVSSSSIHQVWARDVKADLARLRDHYGVRTIVCLLNDAELRSLKVLTHSHSHPLTHPLTHTLTHSPAYSMTHTLTHSHTLSHTLSTLSRTQTRATHTHSPFLTHTHTHTTRTRRFATANSSASRTTCTTWSSQ
jgi:hypothetical protein